MRKRLLIQRLIRDLNITRSALSAFLDTAQAPPRIRRSGYTEILTLREELAMAADALALASQLTQDKGISLSCRSARRALRESEERTAGQRRPSEEGI